MSCPTSVPTFPWKDCAYSPAVLTAENYHDDTGSVYECYDSAPLPKERPRYKATVSVERLQRKELEMWHKEYVAYGTKPFALYGDHGGVLKWWVAKLINNNLSFKYSGLRRDTTLDVHIIGYAGTVTESTPSEEIVDDAGNNVTDDSGNNAYTDFTVGTATNITCL